MPDTRSLAPVFADIVGQDNMIADPDRLNALAIDGVVPGLLASPKTIEETSNIMATAYKNNLAVVPIGGGTKMSLGGIPSRADILISTKRMNRYIDYDIDNLTIELECGETIAAAQAKLAAEGKGYFLPLDPPHSRDATVGGVVATNDNGPRRLLYGGLRDNVLGNILVLPNGEIVKAGGKVVKNVASYDLTKLCIGSLGSLGIICRTTFKIYLKPEAEATLFLSFKELKEAGSFLRKVISSFYYPAALELMTANALTNYKDLIKTDGNYIVAIGLEGISEAVERQNKDLSEMGKNEGASTAASVKGESHRNFWLAYKDFTDELTKTDPNLVLLKSNFVISQHAEMFAASEKALKDTGLKYALAAHAGSGILYTAILAGQDLETKKESLVGKIKQLTDRAVEHDGNLVVEKAPLSVKRKISVWGQMKDGFHLARGLKEKFDPTGIINPGRYIGGI